ncbi:MAG: CRISPR-associated helicase Cas3' [Armatimonadota bacterium]
MPERQTCFAHSCSKCGHEDPVWCHLAAVACRASEYAQAFGAGDEGYIAGLLHDLGKYGDLFQRRLQGKERGIDHWSIGASVALQTFDRAGLAAALAIQGHHLGLQQASDAGLRALQPKKLEEALAQAGLRPSEADADVLLHRLGEDGISLPAPPGASVCEVWDAQWAAAMLDVRMLFSALVDADFIETEAHFQARDAESTTYRPEGPVLDAEAALQVVLAHVREVAEQSDASVTVKQLRSDVHEACLRAAEEAQGLFTLTAPTGTGKTLAMLAFALKHAAAHGLRRVVCVIPYLTIIEQTVGVYRKALEAVAIEDSQSYVLEDHSLAGARGRPRTEGDGGGEEEDQSRLLAENWDAPIVVTTSVQFLESLFANRPAACRKLHRLAGSVILFDEVQTLPARLAVPTLATLSRLAERYRASVVFATATQPAFDHLDEAVRRYCVGGWRPREIVPPDLKLFGRARRTRVRWPEDPSAFASWPKLAACMKKAGQALCVVNLKRHAVALFRELETCGAEGLYHLSTSMCPAHRKAVLAEVQERLKANDRCLLVSTQCVEAGVDVDFPVVLRAWGPLEAIAQAAGRCNRHGRQDLSLVYVFRPTPDAGRSFPDKSYEQAASVAWALLQDITPERADIHAPELFDDYYRRLYDVKGLGQDQNDKLAEMIRGLNFAEVARCYRVIDQDSINVLVPYCRELFDQLAEQAMSWGLNREWIINARPHAIGLFRPRPNDPILDWLEAVRVGPRRLPSDEWFLYRGDDYDPRTGLTPKDSLDLLIA